MTETLTNRVKAIKNDDAENVLIAEINSAFDKLDNSFIPSAKMHQITPQTLTHNVTTNVNFDTTTFDTFAARSEGAMADLANNHITIRKAGVYLLLGSVGFASNATGVRRCSLQVNGTAVATDIDQATATSITMVSISTSEVLAVNDLITLTAVQTSGGNLDTNNAAVTKGIFLSAIWLGGAVEV